MGESRVVLTGMGWVTPLGCEVESVWKLLLSGASGMSPLDRFAGQTFKTNFAAQVRDFRLSDHIDNAHEFDATDIRAKFALAAANKAWRQAGLHLFAADGRLNPRRTGIYLGAGEGVLDFNAIAAAAVGACSRTSDGASGGAAEQFSSARWGEVAYRVLDSRRELEQEPNMVLTHIARRFGCRGPSSNCMTACAASTQSVGEAFEILRYGGKGDADIMLAGGAHSMIHPLGMTGFIRLTAMSRRGDEPSAAARPFDRSRDGFVMGEGAGMLVLERLDHAKSRSAPILAEIVGYGSSADAFRITDIQPDGRGGQAAMAQACRQAGINPREPGSDGRPQVHYISAHGTGTKENDKIETAAVKAVFGAQALRIPFSSVKSMLGHLIQAAGAVELMTCVQAIRTGWVPPTMNLREPDPECDLDYVPNKARDLNPVGGVSLCISNGFGFGGQNDCVAVKRFQE